MSTYRGAGVDQDGADALVPMFARHAARTAASGLGGFSGLLRLDDERSLAISTDTTGTKCELLARAGLHATAGWDAVAMNVDDVVCSGARPLAVVDCIAIERLEAAVVEGIVAGVADACVEAGCALVGGETAQLPGLLRDGLYEVVVTCVGSVHPARTWGRHRVRPGDAIVGLPSSGPHSNGFSLIRRLAADVPPEVLAPTVIYCARLLRAAASHEVHAAVHVTGGGIGGNLARALPDGAGARLDQTSWPCPPVFGWIASLGVEPEEMARVFNLGLGMLVVGPDGPALAGALGGYEVGEVTSRPGITPLAYGG